MDRKYRPIVFGDVLGQGGTVKVLKKSLDKLDTDGVDPTIFFGPWGSGKTTLARIYARAILCNSRQPDGSPCNQCESCQLQLKDQHPGYVEINGANITKVEEFRKILDSSAYQVAGSKHRVFLIDECHMMSKASQNLFLKPLEDGTPGVYWFFCTTEYTKIIETIRSRCVDYGIRVTPSELIAERVKHICDKEQIPYEDEAILAVVNTKHGHLRDILKFLGQVKDVGGVTAAVLDEYLDIGANDTYLEALLALKTDVARAINLVDSVLTRVPAPDVYNGLAQAAMDAFKVAKGIRPSLVVKDKDLRIKLYEAYGDGVTNITAYLMEKGNRRIDQSFLVSTLLLMQRDPVQGVATAVPTQVIVKEVIREVVTQAPAAAAPAPQAPTAPTPVATRPPEKQTATTPVYSLGIKELEAKARRSAVAPAKSAEKPLNQKGSSPDPKILSDSEFCTLIQRGPLNGR